MVSRQTCVVEKRQNRLPAASGGIALAFACMVCLRAHAASVRVTPHAEVAGPFITLSEISVLDGDEALMFSGLRLGSAPQYGKRKSVRLGFVRSRLRQAGADLASIRVSGASVSEITRESQTIPVKRLEEEALEAVRKQMRSAGQDGVRYACALLPNELQDVRAPLGDWKILARDVDPDLKPGRVQVVLHVLIDDHVYKQLTVPCRIQKWARIPVAREDLPPGRILGPQDVVMKEVNCDHLQKNAVLDLSFILGRKLTSPVDADHPFGSDVLEDEILVSRGATVDVLMTGDGFHVRTHAKALDAGALGQDIPLEYPDTGRRIRARVIGTGKVEVRR